MGHHFSNLTGGLACGTAASTSQSAPFRGLRRAVRPRMATAARLRLLLRHCWRSGFLVLRPAKLIIFFGGGLSRGRLAPQASSAAAGARTHGSGHTTAAGPRVTPPARPYAAARAAAPGRCATYYLAAAVCAQAGEPTRPGAVLAIRVLHVPASPEPRAASLPCSLFASFAPSSSSSSSFSFLLRCRHRRACV